MRIIQELLFPKTCVSCGEWGVSLCERCRASIVYIEKDACFYCDRISLYGITHENCKRPQGLDGVLSATYYTPVIKDIVSALKYHFAYQTTKDVFKALNPLVMAKFRGHGRLYSSAQLQPVPLFWKRHRWRGFNQAQILAECFQTISGNSLSDDIYRRKDTGAQVKTTQRLHRILNLENAFNLKNGKDVKDKTIILIDDVITTGSTVKEAARTLKLEGAKSVFIWSLARD